MLKWWLTKFLLDNWKDNCYTLDKTLTLALTDKTFVREGDKKTHVVAMTDTTFVREVDKKTHMLWQWLTKHLSEEWLTKHLVENWPIPLTLALIHKTIAREMTRKSTRDKTFIRRDDWQKHCLQCVEDAC